MDINWDPLLPYPEQEIECRCGVFYLSHAKCVRVDAKLVVATRKPCPSCGLTSGHVRAARDTFRTTEIISAPKEISNGKIHP